MRLYSHGGLLSCLILAGFLYALPRSAAAARSQDFASLMRPRHRAIVRGWLRREKGLRLAREIDVANRESLQRQREIGDKAYHPFYAVGDFNGDHREDFAVMLVTGRGPYQHTNAFAVAVFNGPFRRAGKISPSFLEEGLDNSHWLFSRQGGGLLVGPPETDSCFTLQPRGKGYVIEY
jgi:hypothetical protein